MTDDYGARTRDWVDVVRRARLGKTVKYVAFALAQYADADGTRIFPGQARLEIELELSENTLQPAMRFLRKVQLIELVRRSNGPKHSDEYRLILGPQVMELVEIWSPNDVTAAIEKLRSAKRGRYRKSTPPDLHPNGRGADPVDEGVDNPVDNEDLHPSTWGADGDVTEGPAPQLVGCETGPAPQLVGDLHPSSWGATTHIPNTTTTTHKTADLSTAVTVPRARTPEDQISDPVNQTCGRHAAAEDDEPEPAGNVIPFPKARAS